MSQNNPKYKRLEALLSEAKQVEPEPSRAPEDQAAEQQHKVQIPDPDVKPIAREAETLDSKPAGTDVRPVEREVESPKVQIPDPDVKPVAKDEVILQAQVTEPVVLPVENEPDVLRAQAPEPGTVPEPLEPIRQAPAAETAEKRMARFLQALSPKKETKVEAESETASHYQLALWTAGIFALLGVIFFLFSLYNVILLQGYFDSSDLILTPVTILMMIAGVIGFVLIRRGKIVQGLWFTFGVAIVPPIFAVLVLGNVFAIALIYTVALSVVLITRVFPVSERRKAIIATVAAVLIMVGIELWNPAFRLRSATLQSFAPYAIGLALIGLVAFFIRQAAIGSIRTKLITAFVLIALLSTGIASYTSIQSMRTTLTRNIGGNLNNLAQAKSAEVGQTVKREYDLVSSLSINEAVRNAAVAASLENVQDQAGIDSLDRQWRAADAADNNADPLVASVLENELSAELLRFKEQFPSHVEVFLTNSQGLNVASTNRTSDYYQGDEEWWRTAAHQGVYIGQPEYDESSNMVAINMASAVYGENGTDIVGVIRSTVDFTTLTDSLIRGRFGETGRTEIYMHNDLDLELEEEGGAYRLAIEEAALDLGVFFQATLPYVELLHNDIPNLASQSPVNVPGSEMASRAISSLGWRVVVLQTSAEALDPVNAQTRNSIILLIILTVSVGVTAVFLARLITNPIVHLKSVAEKVAAGDLNVEAKVTTRDEVGTLAVAFNNMTTQLKNLVGSLEQRVADRTHDLELASEVGRAVTEKVANPEEMLTTAAEMIRARFGLYYTQVYLTDPAGRLLLLRAGTGEVGEMLLKRGHRLMIDTNSLNGRAALEKTPVIVPDTLQSPSFKPNPLLPKTRSEMAIPLIAGGRTLGVLDMQSEEAGTLSEANLPAFEALAGQLAIAIQNSELFAETERARAEIESQAKRLTRTGWMNYMDAIHRPEKNSYVFAHDEIVTLEDDESLPAASANSLSLPLEVSGETIGTFSVELDNEPWTAARKELVQNVARQAAQQVENLRLLETAERYRAEAEGIMRRLTHEGWEDYTGSLSEDQLGYAYDLGEVVALKGEAFKTNRKSLAVPLSVRDEAIGQLVVEKATYSEEAHEIIQAVASQLSFHIENLRLSEQNEKRAAELEAAVTRLRELDRLKSSFLANMSHELRTPLNSILGFADVILEELDGPLTPNMQNDLGLIQKNGQHLLHLINDVLDMAKIEAGRMNLNPEKFQVHEILDEVTSITSPLASEKNISLFIESDSDRNLEIFMDRTRLRQVMINLVNNSIKFTDKGKIALRASRAGFDKVLIRVKDTGIGIPPEKLEDVFSEFAQVDTSTTRKAGGTGLGLPISRKLIEMHGGRLWAESSGVDGEGSTFFVELPLEAQFTEPVERLEK